MNGLSLYAFIAILIVDLIVLLLDLTLYEANKVTVSEICVRYPVVGAMTIAFQAAMPVLLGLHYYLVE